MGPNEAARPALKCPAAKDSARHQTDSMHAGFTLLETLVALLIAMIIVAVAAPALVQSLQADAQAYDLDEARRIVNRLATASYFGWPAADVVADVEARWQLETQVQEGPSDPSTTWEVWEVRSRAHPWFVVHFASGPLSVGHER